MSHMTRNVIVVICMLLQTALCDYTCICNYNVEKAVFSSKSDQGTPIGYMYEFDCKSQIGTEESGWLSVAFEHRIGYIYKDGQTMIQICAGSPPDEDLVTTTPPPPTTTSTVKITSPDKSTITVTSTTPKTSTRQITSTIPSTSMTSSVLSTNTKFPTSSSVLSSKSTLPTVSTSSSLSSTSATTMPPSTTTTVMSTKISSTIPSTTTALQTTKQSTPITSSSPTTFSTATASTSSTTMKVTVASTTMPPSSASTTPQATLKTSTTQPIVTSTSQQIQTTIDTTPSCYELMKDTVTKDNGTLFAYKDKCFELLRVHTTWVNAELECRRKGGHLIEIDDPIEQNVVHQVIETYYHESVWIGLHDRHHEERFEWTSGKVLVYTNWYPGRLDPDNHWKEDCVAMALNKYSGRWEDRDCEETRGFICQFGRHTLKVPALIG